MAQSFVSNIRSRQASATVDICKLEEGEKLPDLTEYDLVIMSGGTFNLVDDSPLPWVEEGLECIQAISRMEKGPKLLGICWGHQAIQYAQGGELQALAGSRVRRQSLQRLQGHAAELT